MRKLLSSVELKIYLTKGRVNQLIKGLRRSESVTIKAKDDYTQRAMTIILIKK